MELLSHCESDGAWFIIVYTVLLPVTINNQIARRPADAQVVAITGKSYRVKEAPAVTQENKKSRKTSEPVTAGAAS